MAKYLIAFAFVLMVGLPLLKVLFFPAHVANKGIGMTYWIVDRTLEADNAIHNYEWFKRKHGEILAAQASIPQTEAALKEAKADGDTESVRHLSQVLLGQRNYAASLRAEYDARASMANRAIFKDIPASFWY